MSRIASLLFAILCYAIFFATFLYLIIFVGDLQLGSVSPKTVDAPASALPVATAIAIDAGLIALFGIQHSVMARPGFKRGWTKIIPPYAERSMYVFIASLMLIIMFRFWQPFGPTIWNVSAPIASDILWIFFWLGWGLVLISTFLINHFELFGLQQAWFHARGRQDQAPRMSEPLLYRLVRHPMMVGFFFALWATPQMSAAHLLLAAGLSVYILVALHYEERDLVGLFGADYENYRARVGMLIPRLRGRA
jgi:protein-S-isoprenylcysteine O-methyltransferase Ste14